MSNQLKGMYLMASLLLACGATHDIGEQWRGSLQEDAGQEGDAGRDGSVSQEDAGLTGSCVDWDDCNLATQICDVGLCRTGCGSNYPGAICGQGEVCDDYICRRTCTAGCPSGTVCDPQSNICRPGGCSAQNPCPPQYGCSTHGTCLPTGTACTTPSSCGPDQVCVQGLCQMWCGPNYPGAICPSGQQCQPNAICG